MMTVAPKQAVRSPIKPAFVLRGLAAAGFLAVASYGACAGQMMPLKVGAWSGGAYASQETGTFSHCAADARYRSGTKLEFSINREQEWALGLSNVFWNLTPGNLYKTKYRVDNGPVVEGMAIAKSSNLVQIFLPGKRQVFENFGYGSTLKVKAADKLMRFRLVDTGTMLETLLKCARRFKSTESAVNNPSAASMQVSLVD